MITRLMWRHLRNYYHGRYLVDKTEYRREFNVKRKHLS